MAKYIVIAPNGQSVSIGMPFGHPVTFSHGDVIINDHLARQYPNIFRMVPDNYGQPEPVVEPEVKDDKVEPPKVTETSTSEKSEVTETKEKKPKKPRKTTTKKATKPKEGKAKKNTFTRG